MEVMSTLKNMGSQMLGNIETAMLVIHDYRAAAARDVSAGLTQGNILGKQQLGRADVGAVTKSVLNDKGVQSFPDSTDRIMRVKFNPSQLTVNASAIPQSRINVTGAESRTISAEQASLNLTVVLFFDDMDTYDSFMWDKYISGLGTVEGVANLGKAVTGQKKHTVQYEVESMVAALRNRYTRTITFRWNEFSFTGSLNTVQARYTMFSTSGRPVRAQVLLRILHEMSPNQLSGWYDHFEKAFGGASTDLVRAGQRVGNLLNINL